MLKKSTYIIFLISCFYKISAMKNEEEEHIPVQCKTFEDYLRLHITTKEEVPDFGLLLILALNCIDQYGKSIIFIYHNELNKTLKKIKFSDLLHGIPNILDLYRSIPETNYNQALIDLLFNELRKSNEEINPIFGKHDNWCGLDNRNAYENDPNSKIFQAQIIKIMRQYGKDEVINKFLSTKEDPELEILAQNRVAIQELMKQDIELQVFKEMPIEEFDTNAKSNDKPESYHNSVLIEETTSKLETEKEKNLMNMSLSSLKSSGFLGVNKYKYNISPLLVNKEFEDQEDPKSELYYVDDSLTEEEMKKIEKIFNYRNNINVAQPLLDLIRMYLEIQNLPKIDEVFPRIKECVIPKSTQDYFVDYKNKEQKKKFL